MLPGLEPRNPNPSSLCVYQFHHSNFPTFDPLEPPPLSEARSLAKGGGSSRVYLEVVGGGAILRCGPRRNLAAAAPLHKIFRDFERLLGTARAPVGGIIKKVLI